jgi:hypothetical protein
MRHKWRAPTILPTDFLVWSSLATVGKCSIDLNIPVHNTFLSIRDLCELKDQVLCVTGAARRAPRPVVSPSAPLVISRMNASFCVTVSRIRSTARFTGALDQSTSMARDRFRSRERSDKVAAMVLSQILTVDGFMELAMRSYPARASNCWNADWPDISNCCLRIMWATSMPSSVAEAELKDLNPFICRVNFLMKR